MTKAEGMFIKTTYKVTIMRNENEFTVDVIWNRLTVIFLCKNNKYITDVTSH